MYRFMIELYPLLLSTREGLDLTPTLEEVKEIAKAYTLAGEKASNKKGIEQDSIKVKNGNILEFILYSEGWLAFPTKALRSFISNISKIEPYKGLITPNGRLFKGESKFLGSNILEDEVSEDTEELELNDEQIFIEVSRLFFRETEENRKKIIKIKEIIKG